MTVYLPAPQDGFAIKGVPVVLIEDFSTGVLIARIEKALSAVCKVNFPSEDIYGGNSLYPHDTIDKDRSATLEIQTSRFQYGLHEVSMGSTVTKATSITMYAIGERHTVPATSTYTVTLTNSTTAVSASVKVYYADHPGTLLTVDTTPASGKYSYTSGVLTFAAADAAKDIIIDYTYTVSSGDLIAVLTNGSVPVVKIALVNSWENQEGVTQAETITVHKAKADGSLEHSEKRGAASTHTLNFKLLDPERADKQLYSIGYQAVS